MTPDEFLALPVDEQVRVAAASCPPEVNARSDAMVQRAAVHEAAIARAKWAHDALLANDAAQSMRALLIGVLVADELRCKALGVPPSTWDETLAQHGFISRAAVAVMRESFSQEATN